MTSDAQLAPDEAHEQPSQTSRIRAANIGNIVRKLKDGKTLTAVEIKSVEAFEETQNQSADLVDVGWLCRTLQITKQNVAQLADAGVLVRQSRNKYKLHESVRNYVARLRGHEAPDGTNWGERIKQLEVEKRQLELAEMRGETMTVSESAQDARKATAIWCTIMRAKIETETPARLLGKDMAELRAELREITDELCAAVTGEFAKLAEAAEAPEE